MKFTSFKLATASIRKSAPTWQSTAPRRRTPLSAWLLVAALLFLAVLLGGVVALDSLQLTAMFAGVLITLPLALWMNTRNLLPVLFVVVFLIQGAVQSFLQLRLGTWFASGMAGLFLMRAVLETFLTQRMPGSKRERKEAAADALMVVAVIYLACFIFSMLLGNATTPQRISALRFGLPMFGVLFSLYWFRWPLLRLQTLWWMVVWITVVQLPLTVYQHFGPPSKVVGWDAVTGTFGTGMSPSLVMFTLAAMVFILARWNYKLSNTMVMSAVWVVGIAIILLGEVKAIAIWFPIALALTLRTRALKNIMTLIMMGAFTVIFVVGTFFAYKAMYWGEQGASGNTLEEKLNHTGGYFFDPSVINYRTGEISRGASLYLWYRDPVPSMQERLVGYGPGASQSSHGTGQGVVAKRYRSISINATALAQLLWDVGIVGAILFTVLISLGVWMGFRRVRRGDPDPRVLAILDTSTVMLVLLLTTLVYNRNLLDEPTTQLLLFFCMGCIVQLTRFPPLSERAPT